jgi:AraC family transcriptional regulator, regulatory protein of adaptative response / methylated-DNA-[protein]-cysteine methyltransferase
MPTARVKRESERELVMGMRLERVSSERLQVAFGVSTVGEFVMASGDAGLVAILLGRDRASLARDLKRALPGAEFIENAVDLRERLGQVAALLNAPGSSFCLPLDLRGSTFGVSVWMALRDIPAGQTRSYGQIARTLPVAATAQEVGAACAANLLAVAIPCHRVVKADGSISGYRWGVSRKRQLLNLEHRERAA